MGLPLKSLFYNFCNHTCYATGYIPYIIMHRYILYAATPRKTVFIVWLDRLFANMYMQRNCKWAGSYLYNEHIYTLLIRACKTIAITEVAVLCQLTFTLFKKNNIKNCFGLKPTWTLSINSTNRKKSQIFDAIACARCHFQTCWARVYSNMRKQFDGSTNMRDSCFESFRSTKQATAHGQ